MSVSSPSAIGPPPIAMRLTGNDRGLLTCYNSVSGAVVSLFSRILSVDGKLVEVQQDFTPAATRAAVTQPWEPGDGFLLSLMLQTTSAVKRGQLYCRVDLQRGLQTVPLIYATLLNDYVHLGYRPTWPFAVQQAPTSGPGVLRSINVGNPAAGADWVQTVPTGARWRLLSVIATFATGAAARNVSIVLDDGATTYFQQGNGGVTQAATTTQTYNYAAGLVMSGTAGSGASLNSAPLPIWAILPAGHRIRSAVAGGTDQWSAIQLLVEEWIEP